MELLLDTHVWFWHLTGSKRLSRALRRRIDRAAGACWLSPVSVWELGMLVQRGRVAVREEFRSWLRRARNAFVTREAPLSFEVALTASQLSLGHRDPADHLLAATTLEYRLVLATADQRLIDTEWLPTVS